MAFRHSKNLKTRDWEEKCLKYKNRNMRSDSWAIIQIEKPVKFITPPISSFSLTVHYLFKERIDETKNEINIPVNEVNA